MDELLQIRERLTKATSILNKRIKIILHVGTQKTGTTSLQYYLAQHTGQYEKLGVLYPTDYSKTDSPKHMWISWYLIRNRLEGLSIRILKIIHSKPHTPVFFLSSEDIYAHWWEYSAIAKDFFGILAEYVDLEFWVWFRHPISYTESFYIQTLKNPQNENTPLFSQDISLQACLKNSWFIQHLDYLGFLREVQSLSTKIKLEVFQYIPNSTISQTCHKLGLPQPTTGELKKNVTFKASTVAALRKLNREVLSVEEKVEAMKSIHALDHQNVGGEPFHCTEEEAAQILKYFEPQRQVLAEEFGLVFED
jgi:hypothetical protein